MLRDQFFPAKILLFGEYSVIRESKALAIPYSLFSGKLTFPDEKNIEPDSELKAFAQYLTKKIKKEELCFNFDIRSFNFDISGGLRFKSSIPQGFGAGSSGALCAAIFNQYGKVSHEHLNDISYLKNVFKELESHFHGSSSGVDPLISYLDSPLEISKTGLRKIVLPEFDESGEGGIFLLNTGRARRTEPLVNLFLEKCSTKAFGSLCDQVLTPITNNCIDSLLVKNTKNLFSSFKELSDFQSEHFSAMIPHLYKDLWLQGLSSDEFYLKLCGAGGGGFLLGITKSLKNLPDEITDLNIRPLLSF